MTSDTDDIFFLEYMPKTGDIVLDVGAGVGEEVTRLSKLVGPPGIIVSIEAHPKTLSWLARLCEANALKNVRLLQLAIVDYQKMNIEGAELPALEGMGLTLGITRHVCISCHDYMADAGGDHATRTKDGVRRILEERGFTISARPNDPRPWVRDYLYGTRPVH